MYLGLETNALEKQVSRSWEEQKLQQRIYEHREGSPKYVFYEGPPTANGKPGIHHVISRALKDSVLRYKTMKGFQIRRKAGWDTHGLPVELEVEKKLGFTNKQQIEEYGIEAFNRLCRESVWEYKDHWHEMTTKMAYMVDLSDPYITMDTDYIESVWWLLSEFYHRGFMYEGYKVSPYCPRCGTGLASHEVALGYKEIKTTSVYVKFKRKDKDEYFLVWTTTPWTLPSNIALAVNPHYDYARVLHRGDILYIEKGLAERVLEGEYEVLDTVKGSDLEGIEYEQLLPYVVPEGKAFVVALADYVTAEDGTGIVHTAPAFGEDDYRTVQRNGLAFVQPVDLEGKFTTTPWKGRFVIDADPDIIAELHAQGKLYKRQKIDHNYPHCWRCSTPLLYYAKTSWYIAMSRLRDELVANNNQVNWYPDYVGEKRFGNWLANLMDWAISRSRYWGTPLNIWTCECGEKKSVSSIAELRALATEPLSEDFELHRPYVDNIKFRCSCGKEMTRVPDVIDVWFDSGAMPFAQYHYPFENKELFEEQFPADFICEGIDQTRGWFNSLMAISTFVMGKAPYKNVLVNDMILDKNGNKMSKSRGNSVDVFEFLDKYGADAIRWYMLYVSPAWLPTRFSEEGLIEVSTKYFGTLRNLYHFFTLYANTDGIDAGSIEIPYAERQELDWWILSKLNRLIRDVDAMMEQFEHMKAVRAIHDFVIEDFSNWYIRRSRRRFWGSEMTNDKRAVFRTTYEVLVAVAKLTAPFAPFISEDMYRKLTGECSVHMADFPQCDPAQIDAHIESRMDLVKELVRLGRSARESVKIKVRQPLSEAIVDGKHRPLIHDLVSLIEEELNVKKVTFEDHLPKYMDFVLKPNFKVLGPMLGSKIGAFGKALSALDQGETAMALERGESVSVSMDGEVFEATSEHIMLNINAKEGFTVRLENNNFTILDTTLTPELIAEGYARELVSKVQQMRKARDLDVADNIELSYSANDAFAAAIEAHRDFVAQETLASSIVRCADIPGGEADQCNGVDVVIDLKVVR